MQHDHALRDFADRHFAACALEASSIGIAEHRLAGTRVAVADYGIDVPGVQQDGDHRVYLLRLDPRSGRLRVDGSFQDELTGEVGVGFERAGWPHGATGPARPAGLLFVTPEPPPAK